MSAIWIRATGKPFITAHQVRMRDVNWIGQCQRCGAITYRIIHEGRHILCVHEPHKAGRTMRGEDMVWATERQYVSTVTSYGEICGRSRYSHMTASPPCNGRVHMVTGGAVWTVFRIGGHPAVAELLAVRFDGGYVIPQ